MSLSKIEDAERKITTGKDAREEMALVVGPNANWQEYLLPAPIAITILGELMLISTAADFTLEKKPPVGGFKHIRWPNSFRASLVQVSNAGWEAFNEAHKNMDKIRLYTANVPDHLKEAVTILMKGTVDEVRDMLPTPMEAINETAEQCLELATFVEKKFEFVMELTAELLEACVSAKAGYESELKETEIALKVANENKQVSEEQKKMARKQYSDLEKAVNRAEAEYYKALDSMPTGYSMIAMKTVDAIATGFSNILTLGMGRRQSDKKDNRGSGGTTGETHALKIDDHTAECYTLAVLVQAKIDSLLSTLFKDDKIDMNTLKESDVVLYCKTHFANIKQNSKGSKTKNPVADRLASLCDRGIRACNELQSLSKDFHSKDTKSLEDTLSQLQKDCLVFVNESKVILGANPSDCKPPQRLKLRSDTETSDDESAVQSTIKNARFKIETTTAQLEHSRDRFDKACDRMTESSNKLAEVMKEIAKLDIDKIEFEAIKKTLVQGIQAMGELREKWQKLVQFFQMMSNIIKCCLKSSLDKFIKYTDKTSEAKENSGLDEYPISSLRKDMIYQQAFEACKIAYLVNTISGTYVEVSDAHIMEPIAGLGKLLALDPENEKHEIHRQKEALFRRCEGSQNEIKALIGKRKREFNQQIDSRIKKVRSTLEAALPPPTQKELEKAKNVKESLEKKLEDIPSNEESFDVDADVDRFL